MAISRFRTEKAKKDKKEKAKAKPKTRVSKSEAQTPHLYFANRSGRNIESFEVDRTRDDIERDMKAETIGKVLSRTTLKMVKDSEQEDSEREETPEENEPKGRERDDRPGGEDAQEGQSEEIVADKLHEDADRLTESRRSTPLGRAKSGIPNLDRAIEGGFKTNSVTMLGGCAGAGKSIFATHFLLEGIEKQHVPGVYVTFSEDKDSFFENMKRFGWDLTAHEDKNRLTFIIYTPEQLGKEIKTGKGIIGDLIHKMGAKRFVLDGLLPFLLLYQTPLARKEACVELVRLLRRWGCTSLIICKCQSPGKADEHSLLESDVDSIIWLHYFSDGVNRMRCMEIFKMRGTDHIKHIFPFEICAKGLVTHPDKKMRLKCSANR